MNRRVTFGSIALLFLAVAVSAQPSARKPGESSTFVRGDLGFIDSAAGLDLATKSTDAELFRLSAETFLQGFVRDELGATGTETFSTSRMRQDEIGAVHVRFSQSLNGLRVFGADMMVHADAASGIVYAVNGAFARDVDVAHPATAKALAVDKASRAALGLRGRLNGEPELLYFHDVETGKTTLAWRLNLLGSRAGAPFDDDVYVDAVGHHKLASVPRIHTVKSRRSYDGTGVTTVTSTSINGLPGTLKCTDSQTCGNAGVQQAHDGAGTVWDYYNVKFGRDSLNGSGMTLISTAHVGTNWSNAAWYAGQMVYGDGDGSTFSPLTGSFDVIGHELTHGVTQYESGLIYQKESGALNEALSDIFGAASDSYRRGGVVDTATWKIGEDVYTPGTAGDALRYMNNPTADGYSKDYYPERLYAGTCTPSSSNDNCGVHGNSGIANLAYYLLVSGGVHPRSKTTVNVPAIGMTKAEQIFYRAQTTYLTTSSTFSAARTATEQAATDLYGSTSAEKTAVSTAWCAVGVGTCPGSGGGTTALTNGVPVTGLSGSTGAQANYSIAVPAGATNLVISISGGTGDADLYVKLGSAPTTASYDCRPYKSGNAESCTFATPSAGTYYIMLNAYSSYSGVTLTASYTAPGTCGNTSTVTGISATSGTTKSYTFAVASCATKATIAISGGTGDADLYVKFGSAPTTTSYNCRPYLNGNNETCTFQPPSVGTYYIMIRAYSTFSGVTLTSSYQ